MDARGVNGRLRDALRGHSYRQIGDATGHNAESVRRYLNGDTPSAEFLAKVCSAFGISADWALTGDGPERLDEAMETALLQASGPQLMAALAESLELIHRRLDTLEEAVRELGSRLDPPGARMGAR